MSIDQIAPASSVDPDDPFLIAMSAEAARKNTTSGDDLDGALSGIGRSAAVALLVIAFVVGVVALVDGARRSAGADLASELADRPGALSLPVQSRFVDTTVRLVENQAAALYQQPDGSPALRLADDKTGAVAALVDGDGIPVALGVIPPGLSATPERLLISPVSTALTLAATHPDVLSGTTEDSLGRLAVAARSDAFASIASLVDGTTPVASMGPSSSGALDAFGASLSTAAAAIEPTCIAAEVPAPGVVRCGDTAELQNTGLRAVPVVDETGELCGLIPPARFSLSAAERQALVAMIVDGLPFDTAAEPGSIIPGAFDPGASCDGIGAVPTQASVDQIAEWRGQTELIDVALPLARVLGSANGVDGQQLQTVQAGSLDSDASSTRLANAILTIADSGVNSHFGLERQVQATDIQLDGLIQSTIAKLYE